ncbi:MAG TPA: hypothetical protein VMD03_08735 [Steroidobacteraceae bacterium]|nr:hypothetical protein [Steroidobacteraceae bacterium]
MADTTNGEEVRAEAPRVRDHLKAAGAAAADAMRDNATAAADAARARARNATAWARSRLDDLQESVERRPQTATIWALGIGVVAGFLLSNLLRSRD